MIIWCLVLFVLGVLAFLDSIFTFGEIFRRVNSVLFMLVSLGILVRIRTQMKLKEPGKLLPLNSQSEAESKLSSEGKRAVSEPAPKIY